MTDMDDALAMDVLSALKQSDAAGALTLQMADQIEDGASQAAPGSAPFLTASAEAASIQCQALTQKMLAAELRQEAARLAHANRRPGLAVASLATHAVERHGDVAVTPAAGEFADRLNGARRGTSWTPIGLHLRHPQSSISNPPDSD